MHIIIHMTHLKSLSDIITSLHHSFMMEKSSRDKDLPTPIISEFQHVLDHVEKKRVNAMSWNAYSTREEIKTTFVSRDILSHAPFSLGRRLFIC